MKLSVWMKTNGMTHAEFTNAAKYSGHEISVFAVNKWTTGARIPRRKEMQFIYELTNGQVSPDDFYNLPKKHELQNNNI